MAPPSRRARQHEELVVNDRHEASLPWGGGGRGAWVREGWLGEGEGPRAPQALPLLSMPV